MRRTFLAVPFTLALAATALGCTSEQRAKVSETALRNAAPVAATAELQRHNVSVQGDLSCTADVTGDVSEPSKASFTIRCTGTATDGQPILVEGEGTGADVRDGSYVGRVGDREVFRGALR